MNNHNKYILIMTVLLSISLGFLSCNQDDISGIEFTDFPVEVIYEQVGDHPFSITGTVGYFLVRQDGGITP